MKTKTQHNHPYGSQCEVCLQEKPEDHKPSKRLTYAQRKLLRKQGFLTHEQRLKHLKGASK